MADCADLPPEILLYSYPSASRPEHFWAELDRGSARWVPVVLPRSEPTEPTFLQWEKLCPFSLHLSTITPNSYTGIVHKKSALRISLLMQFFEHKV